MQAFGSLYSKRNNQSTVILQLDYLSQACKKHGVKTFDELELLRDDVLELSTRMSEASLSEKDVEGLAQKLAHNLFTLSRQGEEVAKQQTILTSLYFQSLPVRHDNIPETHKKTFEWIFVDKTIGFSEWLESGDGIYWVSGKAGSGKSVLMKFIADHEKTQEALNQWANSRQLITADFYFWNPGSKMQKSLQGLLQSLLFEILRNAPELMPQIIPSRWKRNARYLWQTVGVSFLQALLARQTNSSEDSGRQSALVEEWSLKELTDAFGNLQNYVDLPVNICILIDGLDEYNGDHSGVVYLLRQLATTPHIKLCISSRPWNVFQIAFGSTTQQTLQLEKLTKRDIELFVKTTLEDDKTYAQALEKDTTHQSLVDEIVQKAEGIFLWVTLAVQSLLNGITNADTIPELRKRLEDIPEDLEHLFGHMLATIQPRYKQQATKLFLMTTEANKPLPLMAVSCIDEEVSLSMTSSNNISRSEIISQLQKARRRVNARCNGLVHVYSEDNERSIENFMMEAEAPELLKGLRVGLIHRSVRDFLTTHGNLSSSVSEAINPFHEISVGMLRTIRYLILYPSLDRVQLRERVQDSIMELLAIAYSSETRFQTPESEVLDELSRLLYMTQGSFSLFNIADSDDIEEELKSYLALSADGIRCLSQFGLFWNSFLLGVISSNLVLYVQEKMTASDQMFSPFRVMISLYIGLLEEAVSYIHFIQMSIFLTQRYGIEYLNQPAPDLRMFYISRIRPPPNFGQAKQEIQHKKKIRKIEKVTTENKGTYSESNNTECESASAIKAITNDSEAFPWGTDPRLWHTCPTLLHAVLFLCRHQRTQKVAESQNFGDLIKELLKAGIDPEESVEGLVLWVEVVLSADLYKPISRIDHTVPILAAFLSHGADPNRRLSISMYGFDRYCPRPYSGTPWSLFLTWLYRQFLEEVGEFGKIPQWEEIVEKFLESGADPTINIDLCKGDSQVGVGDLVRRMFSEEFYIKLKRKYGTLSRADEAGTNDLNETNDTYESDESWFSAEG